jgi:hypothetical protein
MTAENAMATSTEATAVAPGKPQKSPEEIFEALRVRETSLSRLLMAYISSGLVFMLFPGTFLGVWNLIQISDRESPRAILPAWIQAHGHAQVFGWVGSFIFGIGFYSIPKLRGEDKGAFRAAWLCWAMWTLGVAFRWFANVYAWEWRVLLPVSSALELAAFGIFYRAVSQHRPAAGGKRRLDLWIWVVIGASLGLLLALLANGALSVYLGLFGRSPAIPHALDQCYLALMGWGFLAPFVWGFSAKWMSVFLGLKPPRPKLLLLAVGVSFLGVMCAFGGSTRAAMALFAVAAGTAITALRMFEPAERKPKTRGVHPTFPFFVRMAYGWLLAAAFLGVGAAQWDSSGGIWGASRHALTVGFVAIMVLSVGQRILPAFAGMRLLWSTKLMFTALTLLALGCTLRVSCEFLAYQSYATWAWDVLPVSAVLELGGITAFAINIFGTFVFEPSHAANQPGVVGIQQGLA